MLPIPGTRQRAHLERNVAAAAVRLDPEEVTALERGVPAAVGDRYPKALMAQLD